MLNQNMRNYLMSLNTKEKNKLIQFILDSNLTRTDPYIESISHRGLMKVRFLEEVPFFNFTLLNSSNI